MKQHEMMEPVEAMDHYKLAHPKRSDMFLHAGKSLRLIGSLFGDRRVPFSRKLLFLGSILGVLVIMFFPDVLGEFALSTVLPVVGTIIGVPIDAGMDWLALALVVVNLLNFFPRELVAEHYERIFKGIPAPIYGEQSQYHA